VAILYTYIRFLYQGELFQAIIALHPQKYKYDKKGNIGKNDISSHGSSPHNTGNCHSSPDSSRISSICDSYLNFRDKKIFSMVLKGKNDMIKGRNAPLKYYMYTDLFITPYLFRLKDPAPLDLDSIFHTDLFNILLDPGGY
jgi:hypothetical protein